MHSLAALDAMGVSGGKAICKAICKAGKPGAFSLGSMGTWLGIQSNP